MFYQQQGKEEESSIIDSAMRRQGFHLSEKLKEISVQRGWGRDAADIAVMVSFGGNVDRRSVLALLRTRKLTTLRTLVRIFAQVDHGICLRFEPLTAGVKPPNTVGFFTSEGLEQKLADTCSTCVCTPKNRFAVASPSAPVKMALPAPQSAR